MATLHEEIQANNEDCHAKMRIEYALKERDARMACLIVEQLRSTADMIDEQSPAVLEAIIDYIKDLRRPHSAAPEHRKSMREAIIIYTEFALKAARKREHRLYYGLTGETEAAPGPGVEVDED